MKDVWRYVWLGVLLTLVLVVIIGPRADGLLALLAVYLLVANAGLLYWLRRRRHP